MKIAELTYIAKRWRTILVVITALFILAFMILLRFSNLNSEQTVLNDALRSSIEQSGPIGAAKQVDNKTALTQLLQAALRQCKIMLKGRFYIDSAQIHPLGIDLHGTGSRWALFPSRADCTYNPASRLTNGIVTPGGLDLLGEYEHLTYQDQSH